MDLFLSILGRMNNDLFLGLDLGTQGARALVVDTGGEVVAQASTALEGAAITNLPAGWFEQDPKVWWNCCKSVLQKVVIELGTRAKSLRAMAVDSTSGTILPIDASGNPLRPAIMYNDGRATDEANVINEASGTFTEKLGYKFGASFALPKILWLQNNEPDDFQKTWKVIHAADFIVGKLTGVYEISDNSNAMKTGYDLIDLCWPDFIKSLIPEEKLPKVICPGDFLAEVSKECSQETGLPSGLPVVGGVSDGTAGFIASGAGNPGEWNSTLGTTLVVRGVSRDLIKDALGRIYCHRHPDGYWLPGGASNVGAECLQIVFPGEDYAELDSAISGLVPTGLLVYPLVKKGERLPFISSDAEGFEVGNAKNDKHTRYAGYLEGIAFVERWIYELMESLGAEVSGAIRATGGGAKSRIWLQIRSNVLNRPFIRPKITECAMGAAIIAASKMAFNDLAEACSSMASSDLVVEPEKDKSEEYESIYHRFRQECAKRMQ